MRAPLLLKTAFELGELLALQEAGISPDELSKKAGWWNSLTEAIGAGGNNEFKQFVAKRMANPALTAAKDTEQYGNILRSKSMIARTKGLSSASGGKALGYNINY